MSDIPLPELSCAFARLGGALPVWRAVVTPRQWRDAASLIRGRSGRLVALWGTDRRAHDSRFGIAAVYATAEGFLWFDLPIDAAASATEDGGLRYPDLAADFPPAERMQRAVADLLGIRAESASAQRPWLRHAAWPETYFPLRREAGGAERFAAEDERYEFVAVEGDGVHEIAVGPVHAGIIEPGHFRFSVVGEKILRLEARLGYVHKGIDKRFEGMDVTAGARLAARVSGDSTVAYGWAYCMAAEALCATAVPARAQWLRALALERERIANHLGDLGALGNDAAFAFGLAQFSRLRETWLRRNREVFGHRLGMDWIVPGGVAGDIPASTLAQLRDDCAALDGEVHRLQSIYDEHAGLQDRFVGTGRMDRDLAARLHCTGMAARASGLGTDLRAALPVAPYDRLAVHVARATGGDVAARVAVRFAELYESLRLIGDIARDVPDGAIRTHAGAAAPDAFGAAAVEGWRGEVFVAIESDGQGRIRRAHCHDPSWQNWPALEHVVMGNIVADFPLINKSFNLSYSGHDL